MIAPLPREVVERIAAGEVIERPASVVRELIDNALDAGATSVRIELGEGGLRLIRVADDGWGIAPEQLALACQPHTTSKVRALADLDGIATLGFRGEALASIAAVATLELVSASGDDGLATGITLAAGDPTSAALSHTARACGTTVTVRDLFQTIPARRALLRGVRAEATRALAVIRSYALAHPAIRFTLVDDGRLTLRTPGTTLRETVAALFGADVARALLALGPLRDEGGAVSGAIAARSISVPTREQIVLAINGRPVTNRALLAAIEAGYRPLLRKGRHPLLIAHCTVAPDLLDVNVHPGKAEVLLRHEAALARTLRDAVYSTLGSVAQSADALAQSTRPTAAHFAPPIQLRLPAPRSRRGLPIAERRGRYSAPPLTDDALPSKLPALVALGQFDETLLLARTAHGDLYLVDQHRAHERILYEALVRQRATLAQTAARAVGALVDRDATTVEDAEDDSYGGAAGQMLLEPVLVELTPLQAQVLLARLSELATLGLECQPFGGSVFLVRALPQVPGAAQQPTAFARDLAVAAAEDSDDWAEHLCTSLACRSAIRRGQVLSLSEQQQLLTDLHQTDAPAVCPHGSPLALRYSHAFFARSFEW